MLQTRFNFNKHAKTLFNNSNNYLCGSKNKTLRRKRKLPVLEQIEITDVAAEGKSLARIDNMVLFVKNLVPGDIADIQVVRKRKKYMEGVAVKIHHKSAERIEPECKHFGICGGCKWQQLPYSKQLEYKQKQVTDSFERIGKVYSSTIQPVIASEETYYYRNKLEFTFSNSRWLTPEEINSENVIENKNAYGFHVPGRHDKVLQINKCHLQPDPSNMIRDSIGKYAMEKGYTFYDVIHHTGLMRNLIIRNTSLNEWMVIVCFGEHDEEKTGDIMEFIKTNFPQITSLYYVINEKKNDTIGDLDIQLFCGKEYILEKFENCTFKIGPKSFFQTNSKQALNLYRITRDLAGLRKDELVYDLYTGTGTIANFVADKCKKVVGIEYVPEAIEDAKENSIMNNIENTVFYSGDIREILSDEFMRDNGKPDVMIIDPPRAGMHPDVTNKVLNSGASRIIYVSCNPATQARDIYILSEKYKVDLLQPVDMFPQTHHIENIARLVLK